MHESPGCPLAPEDEGEPQRPVLGRQVTDLSDLALDSHQHRQVAGPVRLEDLEFRLPTAEGPRRPLHGLIRTVEAGASITAVGRKKSVVLRMSGEGGVAA